MQVCGRSLVISLLCCIAGSGCAARRRPAAFIAPEANVAVRHVAGNPLGEAGERPNPAEPSTTPSAPGNRATSVRVRWVALKAMPAGPLAPLSSTATLISSGSGATPVLSSGRSTRGVRVASGDGAARFLASATSKGLGTDAAAIAESDGVVATDLTAVFTVADPQPVRDPVLRGPAMRRLTIATRLVTPSTSRATTTAPATPTTQPDASLVEVALLAEDLVATPDGGAIVARELVVLEPTPVVDGPERVLVVPFRLSGNRSTSRMVLAVVDIALADDSPEFASLYAKGQAEAKTAAPEAGSLAAWQPRPNWTKLDAALSALSTGSRAALSLAAAEAAAPLCGEVALAADDATVRQLAARIRATLKPPTAQDRDAVAWTMDSACIHMLAEMESANPLPPEMLTVLSVHAGETGRSAGSLAELAKSVGSVAEFNQRVAAENYIDLEDNSPSARVRAFDWLRARKLEPAGFDPLAPPRQRRAALDKAAEPKPAAPPTANSQ